MSKENNSGLNENNTEVVKGKRNLVPVIILVVALIASGVLVGSKYVTNKNSQKMPATLKPGPVVQWDMEMNQNLFSITSRMQVLGELTGEGKAQECRNLSELLTAFAASVSPAPDTEVQNAFATWMQSASNGAVSCASKKQSADEELVVAADNFKAYIGKLNEARIANK